MQLLRTPLNIELGSTEDNYDLVDLIPYEESPLEMIQESYERKGRSLPPNKRNH